MREATHGLAHLDLQDQELKDLEVARMLQEEEIKVLPCNYLHFGGP